MSENTTVTFEIDVSLPDNTPTETEQDAVDAAYEIIHSAPGFDGIDAETFASHVTETAVDVEPESADDAGEEDEAADDADDAGYYVRHDSGSLSGPYNDYTTACRRDASNDHHGVLARDDIGGVDDPIPDGQTLADHLGGSDR